MAKTLSSLGFREGWHFGGRHLPPSQQRPELAALALDVISHWVAVEMAIIELLIRTTGADARPAAAMFGAINSSAAQADVVRAAAGATMEDGLLLKFEAALQMFKETSRERNKLAHWTYGAHHKLPDAILLADPNAVARQLVLVHTAGGQPYEKMADHILVYQRQDFIDLSAEVDELANLIRSIGWMVSQDTSHVPTLVELHQQLCTSPRFQKALARLNERQKSNRVTPPPR